jgi:hypothetical protein
VVIAGSLPGGLCCETRRTHVSGAWAAEGLRRWVVQVYHVLGSV